MENQLMTTSRVYDSRDGMITRSQQNLTVKTQILQQWEALQYGTKQEQQMEIHTDTWQ